MVTGRGIEVGKREQSDSGMGHLCRVRAWRSPTFELGKDLSIELEMRMLPGSSTPVTSSSCRLRRVWAPGEVFCQAFTGAPECAYLTVTC